MGGFSDAVAAKVGRLHDVANQIILDFSNDQRS